MANISSINGNPIVLGTSGLSDGSVTTDKLADGSVTTDKLADDLDRAVDRLYDTISGTSGIGGMYKTANYLISASGIWANAQGVHAYVPVVAGDVISFTANSSKDGVYALLTSDTVAVGDTAPFCTTMQSRYVVTMGTSSGDVTAPSDAKWLYIVLKDQQGNDLTPSSLKVNGVELSYNIRREIDRILDRLDVDNATWFANVVAGLPTAKVVHFSIDDCTFLLSALASETPPSSIWDITEMAAIKNVHDTSGACVTLNVFNESADYDISTIGNTWASEFVAAKSWLRFALHSKNSSTNYADSTSGATDYTKFVNAIYAITGDYGCIDRIPRLSNFAGTLEQCTAMAALAYGPIGFLTADDSRLSYYQDAAQNAFVTSHGKRFDVTHQLTFIKSLPRLDSNINAQVAIDYMVSVDGVADMFIEVFCHQHTSSANATATRINKFATVANYATAHGYMNAFPMDCIS